MRYVNSLGIPRFARVRRSELIEFGNACGLDALKRQLDLGTKMHRCCWEPVDGDHHPACSKAKAAA